MLKNFLKPFIIINRANNSMILKLVAACLVVLANCLIGCSTKPHLFASGLQLQQPQPSANNRLAGEQSKSRQQYFGSYIGRLNARRDHNISGDVFAVDEQTLFIRHFSYDGLAPDAYFWSSVKASQPSDSDGFIVPDEKGSTKPLERYLSKDIVLRLPEGKTLREINWLSIWSRQRRDNLADIMIDKSLIMPRPLEIGPLSAPAATLGSGPEVAQQNTHGVRSGPITIVDAQTFLVPDLHYDGLAPEAYFWLTRGSQGLSPLGIRLKDENGHTQPLRKYSGETVVISLPDELTVYDFDYFGLWCRQFSVNFGQVKIPQQARVPPSPKMLGIKPENKLNCEILYDDLGYEIRWVLDGDDIVMQLVGKIEPTEYMAFGLGKNDSKSEMMNADAVVAWVERQTGQVNAVDYFLGGKQQCDGQQVVNPSLASCPDARLPDGGDSLTLLHGAIVNGYSMVTFKRPQLGIDELYDQHVYSDGQQSVMWAIGQLNSRKEVGYHRLRTRGNMFIDFARNPQWNCPIPDLNASMHNNLPVGASASQLDPTFAASSSAPSPRQRPEPQPTSTVDRSAAPHAPLPASATANRPAIDDQQVRHHEQKTGWFVPSIVCPKDKTFHAQIGPTGGKRGYESITGRPSWGASWYINGVMIPELVVERGESYRFIVEGGNDKTSAPRRHPLYLTDNLEGGFHFKTDDERLKERIFAGVALRGDGQFVPMAEGRLCEWRQTNQTLANPDLYQTFSAYQRSLRLDCQPGGQAAVLQFSPDASTPDTIYYQCYTHRFMGWRIRVVDSCAAYLASLPSSMQGPKRPNDVSSSQQNNNSNNYKRDLMVSQSFKNERHTYSRRNSFDSNPLAANELTFGSPSDSITDFPLDSDTLILNNSQLHQRQPYNLSNFDEVLKLSAADLEFLDQQELQQMMQNAPPSQLPPQLALQLALINQIVDPQLSSQNNQLAAVAKQSNRTTSARMPKTLQSYMRRLASIYYPVQQQLASILSAQPANSSVSNNNQQTGSQQQQQQPIASESAPGGSTSSHSATSNNNGFSLASLMPKPKIDLSKSSLTRKLNKLRFKSGRKLEPTVQTSSGPPKPTNEFNYDIFNNQLAQLEKQQKQLLEFGWNQPAESFHQQPAIYPILAHSNGGFVMDPMAAEQLNYQTSSALANSNNNLMFAQSQRPRVPLQSVGNLYQSQRQRPDQSANSGPDRNKAQWTAPFNQLNDEHAIFITRLPQPLAYPLQADWRQPQSSPPPPPPPPAAAGSKQVSARYPNIQPYNHLGHGGALMQQDQANGRRPQFVSYSDSPQQELGGHLSSMPSIASTVHSDSSRSNYQLAKDSKLLQAANAEMLRPPDDMSTNDSGSMLDLKQNYHQQLPSDQIKLIQTTESSDPNESDHMLAIERFSKLPSERRPPSIVHPYTGEHVLFLDKTNDRLPNNSSRYSKLLSDNSLSHLDIMDTEQSVQTSDLQRLNTTSGRHSPDRLQQSRCSPGTSCQQNRNNNLATSAEPQVQSYLVKPSLQEPNRDKSGSAIDSTTAASTTELASTQVSPPSVMTSPTHIIQELATTTTTTASANTNTITDTTTTTTIDTDQLKINQPLSSLSSAAQRLAQSSTPPLRSNLVEPIRSTLVQNDLIQNGASGDGGFMNGFNNPRISHLNFDSGPFTPIEFNPFQQQHPYPVSQRNFMLRPPPLIESMYHDQVRPEPPVQVASYLSQHLAGQNPLLQLNSEKSTVSKSPVSMSMALASGNNQAGSAANNNSPLARQLTNNDLIILKPSTLMRDNTYILKPEYVSTGTGTGTSNNQLTHDQRASPEDPYNLNSIGDPNEASRKLVGIQFDRLSSLSSPPSTSIALDPLQTSHTINTYNIEQIQTKQSPDSRDKPPKEPAANSTSAEQTNFRSQHRQTSIQIPSTGALEPTSIGSTSSNTPEGVRTNPGGPNSNTLPRDNNTDNAILSHVMSLISSNAIPTPPLLPVASYTNADYFLPSSDRIYRSVRG